MKAARKGKLTGAVKGNRIVIRHAEALKDDGTLDTFTNRNAKATDTYICKGGYYIETYEPRFTYHGFRYVEIKGYPATPDTIRVLGCAVHANLDTAGSFTCSDSLINRIHKNFQWTMLNNMVSIPTDNPVRDERTPCQMDENCIYEAAINNYEMQPYFKNWLDNIYGNTSNPDWSGGQVLGPWLLYQYYGDKRILDHFYNSARGEVDHCIANAVKSKYWRDSFGDWCPPFTDGTYEHSFSEGEIVNTSLYYKITELMSEMAGILGNQKDSIKYALKADSILNDFNTKFLNSSTGVYGDGRQITSIMPLWCGMVPEESEKLVFGSLVKNVTITSSGHFGTGIYGTSFLPDILCDYGRGDVAYRLLNRTDYPSFGDQVLHHRATTVWEQWGPVKTGREMETYDHAMFAGADKTFYTRFGGIRPITPGYKTFLIKPQTPEGLSYVNASINSAYGMIVSDWKVSDGIYANYITVPVNTTATVFIPGTDPNKVFVDGKVYTSSENIRHVRSEDEYLVFEVHPGKYRLSYGAPVDSEFFNESNSHR